MGFELFIARRLKLGRAANTGNQGMNIALTGVLLAVVVMILSITIVMGFKDEVTEKIYQLDPHIKVTNAVLGIDDNYATINGMEVREALQGNQFLEKVKSMSLIADKPAILKTDDEFKGVEYRGVDKGFDWTYIESRLVEGRVPNFADSANVSEVVVSRTLARALKLKTGDKVLTYFIDNKVKVRNSVIVGVFCTDFETFDNTIILGNIALIQQVNGWNSATGNYMGVNMKDTKNVTADSYTLFSILALSCYERHNATLCNVSHTRDNNVAFFSWLSMLDMNVAVILVLMLIVSGFTLVSALLMIILERIRMIGTFKALGCDNNSVRRIFIYLTHKLIFRALLYGNAIGIGLALIQKYFHIIKLNPEVYYMPYVPISINVLTLVLLNVGVVVASYLTLLGPSYVVSTIKPAATMRFD
mgnify:FL=1